MEDSIKSPASVAERVERGAELLDREVPGWEKRVPAGCVSIASPNFCVLGHVFGAYVHGRAALGLTASSSKLAGFMFSDYKDIVSLNRAWHDLISERQGGDHGSVSAG